MEQERKNDNIYNDDDEFFYNNALNPENKEGIWHNKFFKTFLKDKSTNNLFFEKTKTNHFKKNLF